MTKGRCSWSLEKIRGKTEAQSGTFRESVQTLFFWHLHLQSQLLTPFLYHPPIPLHGPWGSLPGQPFLRLGCRQSSSGSFFRTSCKALPQVTGTPLLPLRVQSRWTLSILLWRELIRIMGGLSVLYSILTPSQGGGDVPEGSDQFFQSWTPHSLLGESPQTTELPCSCSLQQQLLR